MPKQKNKKRGAFERISKALTKKFPRTKGRATRREEDKAERERQKRRRKK